MIRGPVWLLRYNYVANVSELRPALRPQHLALAETFVQEKKLLLGGALDPLEKRKGFLVFATESAASEFASRDPYVVAPAGAKIVESFEIDKWNVVVGALYGKQ